MEENYILALFVSFLFGFVFFKKENKVVETRGKIGQSSYLDASSVGNTNSTGVEKYLQNQQEELVQSELTGVSKYLQEKEILNIENTQNVAMSGVAKYLTIKEETLMSGVSRYMARQQTVQAKKITQEDLSGVEK